MKPSNNPEEKKFIKILILVIILSISLGFGLGYLSTFNLRKTPIIIEKCGDPVYERSEQL